MYSTTNGIYDTLHDTSIETGTWAQTVQLGSAWTAPPTFTSSQPQHPVAQMNKTKADLDAPDLKGRHMTGDCVLTNSIMFMQDALFS